MKARIAVVGSRTFNNAQLMSQYLDPLKARIQAVVSGGAPGADRLAEEWARRNGIESVIYAADWGNVDAPGAVVRTHKKTGKPYNVIAGFQRNKHIIDSADVVLAFWDMKSTGTKDSIDYARKLGKPVKIISF